MRFCAAVVAACVAAAALVGAQGSGATRVAARRAAPFPHVTAPRVTPVPVSAMSARQREVLGNMEGNIQVRLCMANAELCRAYWGLVSSNVIRNITIPVRDHELLVMRTAWLTRQRAIWGNHFNCCAMAQAKLTLDEIEDLTVGPEAPAWSDQDRWTLRAVDELFAYRFITEPTWQALKKRFNDAQMFDILMTVGNYTNVTMYFNTFGIQPGQAEKGIPAAFYRDVPAAPSLAEPAKRVAPFAPLKELRFTPADAPATSDEITRFANARGYLLSDGSTPDVERARREIAPIVDPKAPLQVRLCRSLPYLCAAYWDLVQQNTIKNITIPVRDHELLVLRTAWLQRGHTIWGNHVNCCAETQAGLTQAEIARITEGPAAAGWSDSDATTLRAADELNTYRFITEPTWQKLKGRFGDGQLFEIVMTVGNYTNVIGYFNSVGIQPGNGEKGIPPSFYSQTH